jgi:hypothetical protein
MATRIPSPEMSLKVGLCGPGRDSVRMIPHDREEPISQSIMQTEIRRFAQFQYV